MPRLSLRPALWIVMAALGATLTLPASAQWKWRDKGGQIQYSDRPPPAGTADAEILQRPDVTAKKATAAAPPASGASAPLLVPKTGADPELEAKKKKAEQEEAAKKKAEDDRIALAKTDNCSRARGQLRALTDGQRMYRMNDKGEREVMDDNARATEEKRTREVIASDCKQ